MPHSGHALVGQQECKLQIALEENQFDPDPELNPDPDSNPVLGHDCLHSMPHSGDALVGTQPMRVLEDHA